MDTRLLKILEEETAKEKAKKKKKSISNVKKRKGSILEFRRSLDKLF